MPSITLLPTGTFTDMNGTVVSFGAGDLADLAASYDRATDPAPVVIGHPKLADPAYGWVRALSVQGGKLVASVEQLCQSFAEDVRKGRYSKVSASLYAPDNSNNPKPGHWYLRHIGFLGAMAPAIKGLGTASFAQAGGFSSDALIGNIVPPDIGSTRKVEGFAMPAGYSVTVAQAAHFERAMAMQADNPGMAFIEAARLTQ